MALDAFESDDRIGAMVITGSDKAVAAGADVKEMQSKSYMDAYFGDFIGPWERISRCRKPVIAADNARFGQPEIKLGTFPGSGGTQRLPRAVGKAKAMDLILTGRMMDVEEAERAGLVSRVVALAELVDEAVKVGETIAAMSLPAVTMAKEAVNRAFDSPLREGVLFERRLFYSTFALDDQKEGMAAFAEKRSPRFTNR